MYISAKRIIICVPTWLRHTVMNTHGGDNVCIYAGKAYKTERSICS
jgi:hypothetical protein